MEIPSKDLETVGLVKRAIEGDVEAYGALYNIFLDRIYRYVFYQVGNQMLAEDITEEVFVKSWKAIKTCRGREQTFSAWLYRIARNHIIDTRRKTHREVNLDTSNLPETENAETVAETSLEWRTILEAVSSLPEQQKEVILLKFLQEADNTEIEQITGKRQGAIRALQMRALSGLRRRLNIEVDEHDR